MSASIRYDLSFCHDPAQLSPALAWLASAERDTPLVLAGASGCGRRYVLEWLAHHASTHGRTTRVATLDLAGFEPTGLGVAGFVAFLRSFGAELAQEADAALQQLLERVLCTPVAAGSGRWAVAFALLLQLPTPEAVAVELLGAAAETLSADHMLTRVLARLTEHGQVILHVSSESTLSDATTNWLRERCSLEPKVRLALSCATQLASEALVGSAGVGPSALRMELGAPLTLEQALARSEPAAKQLGLDAEQHRALCARAGSHAARLGRALELELLRAAKADTPLPHNRGDLEAWLATQGDDASILCTLLELCAACGQDAPILPLLAARGVNQADAERLIDRIDEGLCGDDAVLPLFVDLAYRHPGFPGLSVYRFRDRTLWAALLEPTDAAAQQAAERALFEFLSTRLVVATRSIAQLFVNLTERTQFALSAGPRQRLRVWVAEAEQAALQASLAADVRAGRVVPDALFTAAQRDVSLSAHQRLALLEASILDEAQLPGDRRLATGALRTELLCAVTRFEDALASAEQALGLLAQQAPEPAGMRGLLLFLSANCQRRLGQLERAIESFKGAAAEAARPRADGSVDVHNRGVCLAEAGHCHAERSEWSAAVALLTEGIAQLRLGTGDARVHPDLLTQLEKNLALCEAKRAESS